jgi:GcrA cell cycle regulator
VIEADCRRRIQGRRSASFEEAIDMSAIHAGWTSERIELLKKLFDAGLSCSQIAGEIGTTRNAVIGKMHRLGLSRPKNLFANRIKPSREAKDVWRPKALRPRIRGLSISAQRERLRAAYPGPAGAEAPVDSPHKCSLLELSPAQCRWPISEPGSQEFGFCGNPSVDGLSYCSGHARLAYRPRRPLNRYLIAAA